MTISTKYVAAFFTVLVVGLVIFYFSDIVAYVIVAWVLSLIGQPFMRFFKRIRIGKFKTGDTACAILTLVTYVLIVGDPTTLQHSLRNLVHVHKLHISHVHSVVVP